MALTVGVAAHYSDKKDCTGAGFGVSRKARAPRNDFRGAKPGFFDDDEPRRAYFIDPTPPLWAPSPRLDAGVGGMRSGVPRRSSRVVPKPDATLRLNSHSTTAWCANTNSYS